MLGLIDALYRFRKISFDLNTQNSNATMRGGLGK